MLRRRLCATAAKYHPAGQLKSFNYGNGFVHNMTLNSRQLPSAMSDIRSGVKAAFSLSNMTYDGLDRLTAITSRWGTNTAHVGSISYDKTGNITAYNVGKTNLTYTHTNNRVDKIKNSANTEVYHFNYDSRGNVTNNKLRTFSFNRANQLDCSALAHQSACATGTNRYTYDGFNRRVKTTDATGISYSMYSQDGTLLFKHKDGFDTNYIYLGKKLIARSEDAFAPQTSGSSRQHNLPFGETVETPKNDVGYTGHKFDTDLGLSYMQQRYYDPAVGVFYSPDPVGFRDVHSFNRYVYANNNPYKYGDPDGRRPKSFSAFVKAATKSLRPSGNDTLQVAIDLMDAGWSADAAIAAAQLSIKRNSSKRTRSDKVKKETWEKNKEKNNGDAQCDKCGKNVEHGKKLENGDKIPENRGDVHHKERLADGGEDSTKNTSLLCNPCHKEEHRSQTNTAVVRVTVSNVR